MFLLTVAHKNVQSMTIERFNRSDENVNRRVCEMTVALCNLGLQTIKPFNLNEPHPKMLSHPYHNPWFNDSIGALDGTYVSAYVPANLHNAFRSRKCAISQNVLGVCDHDMRFIQVCCGWEGISNDAHVLHNALTAVWSGFPFPAPGKYYLVDSAYKNVPGFLEPYKKQRNHLPDFRANRQ